MTLEEAIVEFETNFEKVIAWKSADEGPACEAYPGAPFVTVSSCGIRAVGNPQVQATFPTKEHAVAEWLLIALRYKRTVAGNGKFLYWRTMPEIAEGPGGRWAVYSRMLVSDRAPEEAKVAETA